MTPREWLARVTAIGRRGRRDRDLLDELRFHEDRLTAEHLARGLSPDEAHAAAARELGGIDRTQQAWRDQRTWLPLDEALQDVRYGWRLLRRSPAVSLTAVLTLALAIAAGASVFAVVDAVLLAPLPYPHADRLVQITDYYKPMKAPGVSVTPADVFEWTDRASRLSAITAVSQAQQNITGDGDPLQVNVAGVSSAFGATIGTTPALGAPFSADQFAPGHDRVALISHTLWTSRYGSDPAIVGRSITFDDGPRQVIGVMPAGFLFPAPGFDAWVPLTFTAGDRNNRTGHTMLAFARVRDDDTLESADAQLHSISETLAQQYPDSNRDWSVSTQDARSALVGSSGPVLVAIAVAVALLLLVACANVAGLLLARGLARGREMAIRTSVGASRARLIRQHMTEGLVLAAIAGALGVGLAWLAAPLLAALRPANLLLWKPVAIDLRALACTVGLALIAGVLASVLPALTTSRVRIGAAASQRAAGRGAARVRQALIAGEVALALVLIIGAGLFGRTLVNLTRVPLGFDPDGVISMNVSLPASRYADEARVVAFYDELIGRVRALPGVRGAGAISALPLSGNTSVRPYRTTDLTVDQSRLPNAHYRIVTAGYLEAMRIPLKAGRLFGGRDVAGEPLAVVVNETFARQAFPGTTAVGRRITFGGTDALWADVVGVVGDVRHFGPQVAAPAEMYWNAAQIDAVPGTTLKRLRRNLTLVVAATGDTTSLVPAIRAALHEIDPWQPMATVRSMSSLVDSSLSLARGSAWLLSIFSVAAFGFALLGVVGAAMYAVTQRRRELAVRLAFGAARGAVTRLVLLGAASGALAGVLIGGLLTWLLAKTLTSLSSMLAGVPATDPLTFAAAAFAATTVIVCACWLPSRRAARIDPVIALRD